MHYGTNNLVLRQFDSHFMTVHARINQSINQVTLRGRHLGGDFFDLFILFPEVLPSAS